MRWAEAAIVFAAFLMLPLTALAQATIYNDAGSFQVALQQASKSLNDPQAVQYRQQKFYPYFYTPYQRSMGECFKELPNHSNASFTFIVSVDAKGKVSALTVGNPTDLANCLTAKLVNLRFPPPPMGFFAEKVEQDFKP